MKWMIYYGNRNAIPYYSSKKTLVIKKPFPIYAFTKNKTRRTKFTENKTQRKITGPHR